MQSLEQERLLAVLLLSGLTALLVLAALSLGGSMPELPAPNRGPDEARTLIPVGGVDALFAPSSIAQLALRTNLHSPFYTTFYQPPLPQAPTTRKVELTYQGFVETAAGERRAFIRTGDTLFVGPIGSKVLADLVVLEITTRTLTLTNSTSTTNVLEFNARKELEVPVQ
jgi:hypothetical protein